MLTGGWHPTHLGSDSRIGSAHFRRCRGTASRTWAARTGWGSHCGGGPGELGFLNCRPGSQGAPPEAVVPQLLIKAPGGPVWAPSHSFLILQVGPGRTLHIPNRIPGEAPSQCPSIIHPRAEAKRHVWGSFPGGRLEVGTCIFTVPGPGNPGMAGQGHIRFQAILDTTHPEMSVHIAAGPAQTLCPKIPTESTLCQRF